MSTDLPIFLTVFADASVCPNTGIAGWASWAKFDGVAAQRSGLVKGRVKATSEAEAKALGNGVIWAMLHFAPPKGTILVAQTDCLEVVHCFRAKGAKHSSPVVRDVASLVCTRVSEAGLRLAVKHVKGHAGGLTRRSWVNEWTDRAAKSEMRAARDAWKIRMMTQEVG